MKQTLFLFFALVISTSCAHGDFSDMDSFIDQVTESISVGREDVQTCVNKAKITFDDIKRFDGIELDNLPTEPFDDESLKLGCFVACLAQNIDVMKGAHLKIHEMKELIKSKDATPDEIATYMQVLETCSDQVKDMNNECQVALKLMTCAMSVVQD